MSKHNPDGTPKRPSYALEPELRALTECCEALECIQNRSSHYRILTFLADRYIGADLIVAEQ